MKNIQANQFYPEMQNFMTTHKEENIFEHFKTTGTDSVCKCIKRPKQKHAFVIDLHQTCRYYFSRSHSKFSPVLRYKNEFLITKYHHSCLTDVSRSLHNVNKQRSGQMLSTQFYKLILLSYHLVLAEALQCK